MSLVLDAGAAVAPHFDDERAPFEPMEDQLAAGEPAFTATRDFGKQAVKQIALNG